MRTKEEIEAEFKKVIYIKKLIYGLGIPDESATDFWNDYNRLQKEYSEHFKANRA